MQTGKNIILRLAIVCFTTLGIAGWAIASNLTVYPVRVLLDEHKPAGELSLQNNDQSPKVIQVELLKWTQQDGEDVYTPSRDLLVNPPVFTIQPGQSQLIRVGMNRRSKNLEELAYRLYIQEVPPPPKPGFTGLKMALRIGVPVFVNPSQTVKPDLNWKASRIDNGEIRLTVANRGNVHMELIDFQLTEPTENKVISKDSKHFYLLPGQSRELILKPAFDWKGDRLNLSANTGRGPVETTLVLDKAKP